MKNILSAVLLVLVLAAKSEATTYWVAATGGSTGSVCGDIDGAADPGVYFRTINAGAACLSGGDTLRIKAGTYVETIRNIFPSGTASAPTTIEGDSRTNTIIRPGAASGHVMYINNTVSHLTFRNLFFDGTNTNGSPFVSDGPAQANFILEDSEFYGPANVSTVNPGSGSPGYIIRRNKIHGSSASQTCIYFRATQGLIEHNEVYNCGSNGIIIQSNNFDSKDTIVRYNYCHDIGLREDDTHRCITLQEDNTLIHNNLLIPGGSHTCVKITLGTNGKFLHNTCIGGGIFVHQANGTGMEIANNIGFGYSGASFNQVGGSATFRYNLCKATCGTNSIVETTAGNIFVNYAGGNYNLIESSVALNAGVQISSSLFSSSGRFVGSQPDLGAFEACIRSSAVVENATPTKYRVNYSCPSQSVRDGVGLQTPTVGNWAIVVAGSGATENSAAIVGTSAVEITLNAAVTNGQSLTDAHTRAATPTLMDNVAIGDPNGTLDTDYFNAQVRTHSAASGTNNVGGAGGATFNVVHARQFNWYSSVASPSWKRLQDVAGGVIAGGRIALAVTIECTGADCDPTAYEWYFNTGGADAAITDTVTTNAIGFANDAASLSDQATVSTLLSGLTCPHATFVAGAVIGKQTTQPEINLSEDSCTTLIGLFQTKSDASGTINVKPKLPGGTAISYGVTPSLAIKPPESGI